MKKYIILALSVIFPVLVMADDSGWIGGPPEGYVFYKYVEATKTLIIEGNAPLNVWFTDLQPWAKYRENITTVEIKDGVKSIGQMSFTNLPNLETVSIPQSVKSIGQASFQGCKSLKFISIPNGVELIRSDAFRNCIELEEVKFPESLKVIEPCAFLFCEKLKNVVLPNDLESLGYSAFAHCESLEHIKIPNGIEKIESGLFYHCDKLAEIILPENLKEIESDFFSYTSVKTITLPKNINSINAETFILCPALEDVYCYNEIVPAITRTYNNKTLTYVENITLHVPASAVQTYKQAEGWMGFKDIVAIEGSTSIEEVQRNNEDCEYFSIDGGRLSEPREGIIIIRNKKGEAKKVVIK